MAKSKQTSQKSDREKKKKQKQKEKEEKRELRKQNSNKGKGLESMMAYVDHNGKLSDTPPDPKLKVEIKAEDILLGARSFAREETDFIKTGRISIFNADRGFGFIKDSGSQEKIFFHISDVNYEVQEGDDVTYETVRGPRGLSAVNVTKQK
ncbi:MAG: cold shock domain-containing protein [Bacteroidia bacterium]